MFARSLLLFLLQFCFFTISFGDESCSDENYYLDPADNQCKQCERCQPGYQPKEYCGYGTKSEEYTCEACPANTFSSTTGYSRCLTCKPCARWNSHILHECTATSDRECGDCYNGYFRPLQYGGTKDDECHRCPEDVKDIKECQINGESWKWKTVAICVSVLAAFLLLLSIILVYCGCKQIVCFSPGIDDKSDEMSSSSPEQSPLTAARPPQLSNRDSRIYNQSDRDEKRASDVSLCLQSETSAKCNDDDQIVPTKDFSLELSETQTSGIVTDMFSGSKEIPLFAEAIHRPMVTCPGATISMQPSVQNTMYSDMLTAEFEESLTYSTRPTLECTSNNSPPSLPGNPTQFIIEREAFGIVDQANDVNTNRNCNTEQAAEQEAGTSNPVRRRESSGSRRRKQTAPTSSSESLLANMDRDSKVVGRQRLSPISLDLTGRVEFFDTNSVNGEETKPLCSDDIPLGILSPAFRPNSPLVFNFPFDSQTNSVPLVQDHFPGNITRPRPVTQPCILQAGLIPPPDIDLTSLQSLPSCEANSKNRYLPSPDAIFIGHKTNIKKIEEKFKKACEKVKGVPLQNLDSSLSDAITLKLTDRPECAGEAYPTIKSWRHVAHCFQMGSDMVDNSRSLADVLRYLRAHRCHTVEDLLEAVNRIQRYDVLAVMCNHILELEDDTEVTTMESSSSCML